MDDARESFMARRSFLALSALGGGLGGHATTGAAPAQAAESDGRSLLDIDADQDARPDGKPIFWLTCLARICREGWNCLPPL